MLISGDAAVIRSVFFMGVFIAELIRTKQDDVERRRRYDGHAIVFDNFSCEW